MDVAGFRLTFFDAPAVRKAAGDAVGKAMARFGAFVRRRAKSSIRKKKGTSAAGSPPHSHEGTLRRLILFAYDPARRSVIIGAARGGSATDAPAALEHGGPTAVAGGTAAGTRVDVAARPFMGPAFATELPNFKSLIR